MQIPQSIFSPKSSCLWREMRSWPLHFFLLRYLGDFGTVDVSAYLPCCALVIFFGYSYFRSLGDLLCCLCMEGSYFQAVDPMVPDTPRV